ncbi:hypothetical protein B0J14DRAFT_662692 [Halenospora varia]|nr:hypothetical protein B0J14DRAFT_662692 [Halenospora varia]
MASSSNSNGSLKRCAPFSDADEEPDSRFKRARLGTSLEQGRAFSMENEEDKKTVATLNNSQLAKILLKAIARDASLQEVVLHAAKVAMFQPLKYDSDLDEDFDSGLGHVSRWVGTGGLTQSAVTAIANIVQIVEEVVAIATASSLVDNTLRALEIVIRFAHITTWDCQIITGAIYADIERVQGLAEVSDMMDAYVLCDVMDLFTHPSRPLDFHGTVSYLYEVITDLLRIATATSEIFPRVRRLLHTVIHRGVLAKIGRRTCIQTRVKAMGVLTCIGDILVLIYKLEQQIWEVDLVAPCPVEGMLMDAMQRVIGYSLQWEKEDDMDAFCQDEVLVKILLRLDESRGEYLAGLRSILKEFGLREPDDEAMGLIEEIFDEKMGLGEETFDQNPDLIERGFEESLSVVEIIDEKMELIEDTVKLEPIETIVEIKVEDSDSDRETLE